MNRALTILAAAAVLTLTSGGAVSAAPSPVAPARDGGPLTDSTDLAFTNSAGTTSTYHLYAAELDWAKPVGLLAYTDGTGEYGLTNPGSDYLIGGEDGLAAVAERNNMVLLTPLAPGDGCDCWYETDDGGSPAEKAAWSRDLILDVQAQYPIDTARVAFGGYSSGAQWTTRFFGPTFAPQVMTDGVAVAISYGGAPAGAVDIPDVFKAGVPFVWDVGADDPALDGAAGARDGYDWYTGAGFTTALTVVPGVGHDRSGQFGRVIEDAIREHVGPGSATPAPTTTTPVVATPVVTTTAPTPPVTPTLAVTEPTTPPPTRVVDVVDSWDCGTPRSGWAHEHTHWRSHPRG